MGIQIRFVISARAEGHDALADLTRAHARPISWQVAPGGIYIPPPVASPLQLLVQGSDHHGENRTG